jgi:hypothetical protein
MRLWATIVFSLLTLTLCSASDQPNTNLSNMPRAARSSILAKVAELTRTDGTQFGDFGLSVAISADTNTIAVGAFYNNSGQGAIYVFVKPAGGWQNMTQTAELTVSGLPVQALGYPIAMSPDGNTIVGNGIETTSPEGGSQVFVFVKPAGGWTNSTQTAALYAKGGGNIGFGNKIATDGDNILVGATGCGGNGDFGPGAVYLFVKPAGGWSNMTESGALEESDLYGCDDYGASVAISGDTAVVGKTGAGMTPPASPGAFYVFTKPAGGWATETQTAKLTTSNTKQLNELGGNVALSGGTILGETRFIVHGGFTSATYVFSKPAGGWVDMTQTATFTNSAAGVSMGPYVALDGATAAVSLKSGNHSFVTLYYEPTGGWQNTSAPNVTLFAEEAGAVALSGGLVVAGNPNQGAAYVFENK